MNPPPLFVSFQSAEQLLAALPTGLANSYGKSIRELSERGLPPASSVRVVATLFGVSPKFIGTLRSRSARYYRTYEIRSGKKIRQISSPRVGLKVVQKWIGFHLAEALRFLPGVTGFVPGKSYFDAALLHCGAKWVFSIDVRDFFPSVRGVRICEALMRLGYSANAAKLVTDLCCLHDRLPQGSPASPVLSNLVFSALDARLQNLAATHQVRYSRYADDMVFSGFGDVPEDLLQALKQEVVRDGWMLAEDKEYLSVAPSRMKVHGLIVNGDVPRLTRGYRNRIRMYEYLMAAHPKRVENECKIKGHLNHAGDINGRAVSAKKKLELWSDLNTENFSIE